MEVESRIFKVIDKIFKFSIQCQGKEKLDLGNQGFSRFNLEKPQKSRQLQGQHFQGQGINFKEKSILSILDFFKVNP